MLNGYLRPAPEAAGDYIAGQQAAIEAEFQRRVSAPIAFPVDGTEYEWHADDEAIQNIMGVVLLIAAGVPVDNPRPWTPRGSLTPVDITHAELVGLGATIAARKDVLFAAKKTKQSTVAAMTDPAEVAAFDVTADWPA